MTEQTPDQPPAVNGDELKWVWVLTSSQSPDNDSIFVVELSADNDDDTQRRVVPIFASREVAQGLQSRLGGSREHTAQAMLLTDVGHFAAQHNLEIMLLNQDGGIVAHLEAEMVPTH